MFLHDLLLAGEGPERPKLEALIGSLNIGARVHFLGVRKDVPELLRAVDVFALTSVSEAASLTLLEAMASGCPSVVTNVGGNPELVRHGLDGLLVPRGDYVAAGQAMLKILDNPTLAQQMGTTARNRVVERFSLANTIEKHYRVYARLTGRGTR